MALLHDFLKDRREAAFTELDKLFQDRRDFPINYNHYYTDTVHKKRQERIKAQMKRHIPKDFHQSTQKCSVGPHYSWIDVHQELDKIVRCWAGNATPDMERFSCEEALDCLMAIYKVGGLNLPRFLFLTSNLSQVQQKTFIANITTQVIERHIMRGLQEIFSPLVVIDMPDAKIQSIVSEPLATKRARVFLTERIRKLEEGQEIFRAVLEA